MAPQFKVLERFSEEARRKVADRAFAQRSGPADDAPYVCRDGACVLGALLMADGKSMWPTPNAEHVIGRLGTVIGAGEYQEIEQIILMNDAGKLRTRAAVRTLLGVSPTTPHPTGAGDER